MDPAVEDRESQEEQIRRRVLGEAAKVEEATATAERKELQQAALTELKYAYYPHGGHYRRHVDALNANTATSREYSFILYLNEGWRESHGGHLRVFFDFDHLDDEGTESHDEDDDDDDDDDEGGILTHGGRGRKRPAPAAAQYPPALQRSHPVLFRSALNLPTAQASHSALPFRLAENVPGVHGAQNAMLTEPWVAPYRPAGQVLHRYWPSSSWYSPSEHAALKPPEHLYPRGQVRSMCFESTYEPGSTK